MPGPGPSEKMDTPDFFFTKSKTIWIYCDSISKFIFRKVILKVCNRMSGLWESLEYITSQTEEVNGLKDLKRTCMGLLNGRQLSSETLKTLIDAKQKFEKEAGSVEMRNVAGCPYGGGYDPQPKDNVNFVKQQVLSKLHWAVLNAPKEINATTNVRFLVRSF